MPKQFALYEGLPLLRHSVQAFADWGKADCIVVVVAADQHDLAREALRGFDAVRLVTGGEARRDSVRLGLQALADPGSADRVYIHDAARPGLNAAVLDRLARALDSHAGAVPALPVVDSIARGHDGVLREPVDRGGLWRVQTPQAFKLPSILSAHLAWPDTTEATDDACIAQAAGLDVAFVMGDERLKKITFAEDFTMVVAPPARMPRTGMGYDVHRLVAGKELWLGGILIPHDKGLAGHSDADVALHALTDALLGAMALGDIGEHFPPSDPQWRGADSAQFLAHAAQLVRVAGATIANVDLTIICEAPKISPYKHDIQARVATILDIQTNQVAIKATTTERLGFAGRGEGIAAQAIATVITGG